MSVRRLLLSLSLALNCCLFNVAALAQSDATLTDVVCFDSDVGKFCLQLFPDVAPATVANFLNYVRDGRYDGTIIHRSVPGFVIQGGGYTFSNTQGAIEVPADDPVVNEYQLSNLRGTIAMAKLGNDPNSATSEWFINLGDNSANLDNQNGGFTVFGKVVGNGMTVVDLIAQRTVRDLSGQLGPAFTNVPVLKVDSSLTSDDLVTFNRVYEDQVNLDDLNNSGSGTSATAVYSGVSFYVPVHYRGNLYGITFDRTSQPPDFVFAARTTAIVQLNDIGQDAATLENNTLTIPSVLYGTSLYKNVVLQLTDRTIPQFTLVSFERQ